MDRAADAAAEGVYVRARAPSARRSDAGLGRKRLGSQNAASASTDGYGIGTSSAAARRALEVSTRPSARAPDLREGRRFAALIDRRYSESVNQ
jgi:hypothetical protein